MPSTEIDALQKKLLYLLHAALVDIRNLSMAGQVQKATELADVFEWLPSLLAAGGPAEIEIFRADLEAYQSKHRDQVRDYLAVLDMEDEEFYRIYDGW